MRCEICDAGFTAEDEATLPAAVADDGRAGRFCPACRCDLVEDWPSDEPAWEAAELAAVAEWRARYAPGQLST